MAWMRRTGSESSASADARVLCLPEDDERTPGSRPEPPGGLVMVVGRLKPRPRMRSPMTFCYARTGTQAIRLFYQDGIGERLEALVVEDDLIDMSGYALLKRFASEAPSAARVLLLGPGFVPYLPHDLAEMGLDDTWLPPTDGRALADLIVSNRSALARTRAVHRRMEALTADLEEIEQRYTRLRETRDHLARNVEAALRCEGMKRDRMLRWWQGYRAILQFRWGLLPIRFKRMPLLAIIERQLGRRDLERWPHPGPIPENESVWVDSRLVDLTCRYILRGVSEVGTENGWVSWGRLRADANTTSIELKVGPVRDAVIDVDVLMRDPFSRLPDRPLRDLSIDLPYAREMVEAQRGELIATLIEPNLVVEWRMPRRRPVLDNPFGFRPIGTTEC